MTGALPLAVPTAVARHATIGEDELFSRYIEQRLPVIVSDIRPLWPSRPNWTAEELRQRCGAAAVRVSDRSTTLAEVLDAAERSTPEAPSPYLVECTVAKYLPMLLDEVLPLPFEHRNRLLARGLPGREMHAFSSLELLLGGRGTRFPRLHYDHLHMHAIISQLKGDKRFWLYDPSQTPFMYARESAANLSQIDRFDPVDLERWPLHAQAKPLTVIVKEGETIFVPSGWWHRTELLDLSIALTWNLVTRSNWQAHVEDRYLRHSPSPLKRGLKSAYYASLDTALRLRGA